jgi:hypothetical protein
VVNGLVQPFREKREQFFNLSYAQERTEREITDKDRQMVIIPRTVERGLNELVHIIVGPL